MGPHPHRLPALRFARAVGYSRPSAFKTSPGPSPSPGSPVASLGPLVTRDYLLSEHLWGLPHRLSPFASLGPLVTRDYLLSKRSMMPDVSVCFSWCSWG